MSAPDNLAEGAPRRDDPQQRLLDSLTDDEVLDLVGPPPPRARPTPQAPPTPQPLGADEFAWWLDQVTPRTDAERERSRQVVVERVARKRRERAARAYHAARERIARERGG